MKFFVVAVASMAWELVFLFLAVRFLFTATIITGLTIGLVALIYAIVALVRGTSRRIREVRVHLEPSNPEQEAGMRVLTGSILVGSIAILIACVGQLMSGLSGAKGFGPLADFWLGLLAFGLVIQLYGQAAYLRNLA